MTRVFLIAASGRKRERLEDLFEAADAEVVGTAATVDDAAEELLELADVLVLEVNDEPLAEILETLQRQDLPADVPVVLVVAQQRSPTWANQALRARVRGILPRTIGARSLRTALEGVTQGLTVLQLSEDSLQRTDSDATELIEPLTGRERDVLEMLAQGRGNKDIAARLKISEHTVKFHVASILGKLGAGTRTEAVSIALRRGLILF